MNINEVIANRAIELLGGDRFAADKPVHPNDHVNMGQSTNDIFPTAIHVAVATSINATLLPVLQRFASVLAEKAQAWDRIIKIGRTHLADATPLRLGQGIRRVCAATGTVRTAGRARPRRPARTPRRRNRGRVGHQHSSRIRPARGGRVGEGIRHWFH